MFITQMKRKEHRSLKAKTTSLALYWHFHRKVRTYPTWMRENSKSSFKVISKFLQRPELKMFGKKGEHGISTPLILSMRPYAHTS